MWRLAASALAVIGYAVLSQWLMLRQAASPWAIVVLLGPLISMTGAVALARRQWLTVALTAAGWVLIIGIAVRGGVGNVHRLYLLQHVGVHLVLGWTFASSLRPGAVSTITELALRLHGGELTPTMRAYTRQVTKAWVLYFLVMSVLSLGLYRWAPWVAWSAFANLATPLAMTALLLAEHGLRYRLHPEFERVSIAAAMRAFRQPGAAPGR